MKWLFNLIAFAYLAFFFNANAQTFLPPPNPVAPPFITDQGPLLPIVLVNNSGLPDNQVYVVMTGSNPSMPIEQVYVQFNTSDTANKGVGTLIPVNPVTTPGQNAQQYTVQLSQLPTSTSGRVIYIPHVNSAIIWFSLNQALDMPDSTTAPYGIVQPNFSNPNDPNYTTIFDIFEVAFLSTGTNISADATAVSNFALPLYGFITPADADNSNTGLYQPRSFIMSQVESFFSGVPEAAQWKNLILKNPKNNAEILRVVATGKGMAPGTNLFDPNYLDNAAAYGYSYINNIWTSIAPPSFYRTNPLVMTIPAGTLDTYTGVINLDNTITFTGQKGGVVYFLTPTTSTASMTTSQLIFGGELLTGTDNSEDATQLSKLFEEAIISSLVPTSNTLSNPYLSSNQASYYTVNPNLTAQGQSTGPWYDLYSKALHSLGHIYTYAFDEPLWPQVQISSQTFIPGQTYMGITLGPLSEINTPTITSISPDSGPAAGGTSVTITGTNFSDVTNVFFGTTSASFTINSSTTITAISPPGSGVVDITATSPGGTSPLVPADQFTYLGGGPIVTRVTPNSGSTAGGDLVVISGMNLKGNTTTTVLFGSAAAEEIIFNSENKIIVRSPPGSGTLDITVTTSDGTSPVTSDDQFTYISPPTVTSISPSSGSTSGGTSVIITGTNFTADAKVFFGAALSNNVIFNSAISLTAVSPAGSAGTVDVTVETSGGTSPTSSADLFTYLVVPQILDVNPNSGHTAGGTSVIIQGTGFDGATQVFFGSNPAAFTVNSNTQISATSPAGSAGTVDVTVVAPGGTSEKTAEDQFTYISAPSITAVSPNTGPVGGGTPVTISGSGFTNASEVKFGSNSVTIFTVIDDSTIETTSPPGVIGIVDVQVTSAGGTSPIVLADKFTYANGPVITSVSPNAGPVAGGTVVAITGSGFTDVTQVFFGSVPAAGFTFNNDSSITATSPSEAASTVHITVQTGIGTSPTSNADLFHFLPIPSVANVNPTFGPTAGGTVVTITGQGFYLVSDVKFGALSAASITTINNTTIQATSPASAAGTVDITVVTPGGTSPTSAADKFTFTAAPIVASISPNSGPVGGGTVVTITGSGFTGVTVVDFGAGFPSPTVVFISDNLITAASPAHSAGTVDVTVTTPSGTSMITAADRFTYGSVPAVNSLSPNSGPTSGGTSVTIAGAGFTTATQVDFGGIIITSFTINNDSSITITSPAHSAGSFDVTVTNLSGTSPTTNNDIFTFVAAPVITGVVPNNGSTNGGTSVTISGSGFTKATNVFFGATAATQFAVTNDATIVATSPAGTGTVDVTVVSPGGTSATGAADKFTYFATPTVTSVTPRFGPIAGGQSVTIKGTGFTEASIVNFGSTAVTTFSIVDDSTIEVVSPAHAAGPVHVTVTSPFGTSLTSIADLYDFGIAPMITEITPNSGPTAGGTLVTITGTRFLLATEVKFGDTDAQSFTIVNNSTITAISPAHSAGNVDIRITTPAGVSAITTEDLFTYDSIPVITQISPTRGSVNGGTQVSIFGTGFSNTLDVLFGSLSATTFTRVSDTVLVATAPPQPLSTVDVRVQTSGGTSVITPADKFQYVNKPVITSISPRFGPLSGGTSVTILGQGFTEAIFVLFGNSNAFSFEVINDTTIIAVSPQRAEGVVGVRVITPGGISDNIIEDEFAYLQLIPTVTHLSPNSGPGEGGNTVIITGTEFFHVLAVDFGQTPALSFIVINETTIEAVAPPGTGAVNVFVTTSEGISAKGNDNLYTYITVFPPRDLKSALRKNKFATQTDNIIVLTWKAPKTGHEPVSYRIYRNESLTKLAGTVPALPKKLEFKDHNRKKGHTYTYYVVSVDSAGNQSTPAVIVVRFK